MRLIRIAVVILAVLVCGCAEQPATIGQWFGPTVPAAVSIRPEPDAEQSARIAQTAHYIIYTNLDDTDLINRIGQLMEGSYSAYRTLAPDTTESQTPMQCYIFQRRDQWAEFTRLHTGPAADLYLHINRGAYTVGDWYVAYYIGEGSTISVAAHEGWHQFRARHFKATLPLFLEEGLATMFEGVQFKDGLPCYNLSINQNRAIALRSAIETHSLWPFQQVIGMGAGDVVKRPGNEIEAFYAQAWALGRFLWDGDHGAHRAALQQLLADAAHGTIYDPTGPPHNRVRPWRQNGVKLMLEHYLQMDIEQIDTAYQAFCRHIAYDELPTMSALPP